MSPSEEDRILFIAGFATLDIFDRRPHSFRSIQRIDCYITKKNMTKQAEESKDDEAPLPADDAAGETTDHESPEEKEDIAQTDPTSPAADDPPVDDDTNDGKGDGDEGGDDDVADKEDKKVEGKDEDKGEDKTKSTDDSKAEEPQEDNKEEEEEVPKEKEDERVKEADDKDEDVQPEQKKFDADEEGAQSEQKDVDAKDEDDQSEQKEVGAKEEDAIPEKKQADSEKEDTKSEQQQEDEEKKKPDPEPQGKPEQTSGGDEEQSDPDWTKDEEKGKEPEEMEKKVAVVGKKSKTKQSKKVLSKVEDKKSDITTLKAVDKKDSDKPATDWAEEEEIEVKPGSNPFDEEEGPDDVRDEEEAKSSKSSKKIKKKPSDWAKSDSNVSGEVVPLVVAPGHTVIAGDGHGGLNVAGIHISEMRLPLVGMFMSAAVLLISVLVYKGTIRWRDYAISVPSATMCLSFLMLLMTCKPDFYTDYGKIPNQITFLWNFVGACMLTFGSPFETTGNGYFAAWFSVIFSAAALGFTASAFESSIRGMGALTGLMCSSIIVVVAIVGWLGKDSFYRYEAIYAMCVSIVTMIMILALLVRQKMTEGKAARGCEGLVGFIVLCIFAALWVALAAICTFRGPFLTTGNGYFSSWTGAACACFAAFASRNKKDQPAQAPKEEINENWAEDDDSPV